MLIGERGEGQAHHETGRRVESFCHDLRSPKRTASSLKLDGPVRMVFRGEVRHCLDAVACGERVRDHVPGMAIALFSGTVAFWQLLLLPPLNRRSSCRAGDGVLSRLRAGGSKSSVAHAHLQFSGPLFPRGKATARAPKNQRQPLQNPRKSSRSWSRKGTWHRSRRRSGLLGQIPSPQFWPVSKKLSRKRRISRSQSQRERLSPDPPTG